MSGFLLQAKQLFAIFPRPHLIAAAAIVFLLIISLSFSPESNNSTKTQIPLPLSFKAQDLAVKPEQSDSGALEQQAPETSRYSWRSLKVKKGDTLSSLFQRANIPAKQMFQLLNSNKDSKRLTRLKPKETISVAVEQGQLVALKYSPDLLNQITYTLEGDVFSDQRLVREPEVRVKFAQAKVNSSLFLAAQNAGLSQNLIMELADIFAGVMDFVYDPRQGDSFSLLYEELYIDDKKYKNGNILAAQYINAGEAFKAYRYQSSKGDTGYYNESGVSMRKTFLRAPLDFTRISSSFNLRRLHPVFKTRKPHRGIDYAAPRGTPVYAAGDGRVLKSGYNKANGNFVFIQHGAKYVTKYLHLHKRKVRSGQRVKQKQLIGSVGTTGYSTGPHLHYEFLVNGVHRNPKTIFRKLPKARSIKKSEYPLFKSHVAGLSLQLETLSQDKLTQVAGN